MCRRCGIWGASDETANPFELSEEEALRAPAEGHEFHLLDSFTAYCICGWFDSEYSSLDPPAEITPRIAQRYRDHL